MKKKEKDMIVLCALILLASVVRRKKISGIVGRKAIDGI
jgi:hypothetical protein